MISPANGSATHSEPEQFQIAAYQEIVALPFWVSGECFNPNCCAPFEVSRDGRKYCCKACAKKDYAEWRRWGAKAALALLVHRMHHHPKSKAEKALCSSARRYVWQVQSTWLKSRQARCALARKVRAI